LVRSFAVNSHERSGKFQNDLRKLFEQYWQTPQMAALDRVKLFKLVWDLVGSEFAGRHLQYEKLYLGASFTVRAHNYREAPWPDYRRIVDDLLASYDVPASPMSSRRGG